MHCFRVTLKEGDRPRLEHARAFVQFREAGQGAGWYGYLMVASAADIEPGGPYTLHLEDGRAGPIRIDEVTAEDPETNRAVFVGLGPLG